MSLVTCVNVHKNYATQAVLDGLSLTIHPGERIGLVGPNGCGKTTLLRIVAGLEPPDAGQVARRGGVRISYLPQEPQFDSDEPLCDAVASVFHDLVRLQHEFEEAARQIAIHHEGDQGQRWMDHYEKLRTAFEAADGYRWQARLGETLAGVGFEPRQHHQSVRTLSGGQKCRAALAKVLLENPDVLLLDEPTNHLDLQGVTWLEDYLATFNGTVVVVSHDRYLLNKVVSKIVEMDAGRARTWPGNYTAYAAARAQQIAADIEAYDRQQDFIRKQLEYAERVKSDKKRARQAAGRLKMVERLKDSDAFIEAPPAGPQVVNFRLSKKQVAGDLAVRYTDVSKGYDGKPILRGVTLDVNVGDRLGVIGPNGVGKSTLLKITVGQVTPDTGEAKVYRPDSVAYYDQQQSDLDDANQILHEMWSVKPQASQGEIRNYVAPFGFRGDDIFKPIAGLSGGQRSRLILAKRIWSEPDLLLLDEPTNHLDISSREALENALAHFGGTIVLVTHDRYLLDKVATKLLVLEPNGRHSLHYGNYSAYAERMKKPKATPGVQQPRPRRSPPQGKSQPARHPQPPRRQAQHKKPSHPAQAQARKADAPKLPYELQKLTAEQVEQRIGKAEAQLAELQQRFGDSAVASNPARLKELQVKCAHLERDLQLLYAAWEAKLA